MKNQIKLFCIALAGAFMLAACGGPKLIILLNNTIGERVERLSQLTWDMAIMITEGFLLVQP